jgi:hypothetical protein
VADTLYAHGTAAIVGNNQIVTPETLPFYERANEVYREHASELAHQGAFPTAEDPTSHPLEGSPRFYDHRQVGHAWDWTLSTEDYIAKLGTHSNHAALADDVRLRLHGAIAELVVDEFGGSVREHYVALVALARRAH